MIEKEKGITLVSLVITVIIMLILAAVEISMNIVDNGIFKKAKEGSEIYKNSANNEVASLKDADKEMEELMNQYQGGSAGGDSNLGDENGYPEGIYTANKTINGEKASAFIIQKYQKDLNQ